MDVVYPVGTGSLWENNELRYSLRSLKWQVAHRKVFVVGVCPPWYTGRHVPFKDEPGRYVSNQVRKLEVMVNMRELSDHFLWMNDDFFFTDVWRDRRLYHRRVSPKRSGVYAQAYENARAIVGPGLDYEIHHPVIYSKERCRRILEHVRGKRNFAFRTVYFHGMNSEPADDCKLFTWQQPPTPFFSISSGLVKNAQFQQWMKSAYPTPSPWEVAGAT